MEDRYILGFDLERSGPSYKYKTFSLGAVVINSNKEILDSLLVVIPIPEEKEFEESCWKFCWSKNLDILEKLRKMVNCSDEKEMIEKFQDFRRKWEKEASEKKIPIDLVCDNTAFDAFFLNDLICKYTQDFPMPYTATHPQSYEDVFETTSMIRGFLLAKAPTFTSTWGIAAKFRELYGIKYDIGHDHNPVNDATTIAFDYVNVLEKSRV